MCRSCELGLATRCHETRYNHDPDCCCWINTSEELVRCPACPTHGREDPPADWHDDRADNSVGYQPGR